MSGPRDAVADRGAVLATLVAVVFALTFLALPRLGGGWFWETGNALGFLALAGLLFQMIPYPRSGAARRHERLGYWVLATAIAHAFWFLAGDPTLRVYLQPGAPAHMWLGLFGLLALALLCVLARMPDRMRVHRRYRVFRTLHRGLGLAALAGAGLHVLLSGFYLPSWPQAALLVLICLACSLGRRVWARLQAPPRASAGIYLATGAVAGALFVLIRNLVP
ncbi:ferric reductase-like transmembrane domain-containing protein [Paracoccus marinaquae]|uniref:Ferric reductase-like transmembrane domain-containing protein n=1 Tax=Paracoccus marinaquae TaxID=2841926 RepID=A0ABS6ADQ7_9RHOB|nr:ferric reductase-like transmembrane domain-containing protein [Paracoccus marinaquae]MBU3028733.1 ferric reductase-like transmembrane domain-containing protein [Paracoccus marinaquae]